MKIKAEMRPAYEWTCDECGRNQFESCIVAEMSPEERLEMAHDLGLCNELAEIIPDLLQGDFVTYPDSVTCNACGANFETIHHLEDTNDELI